MSRDLEYVIKMARYRNLSVAAKKMKLTQPALSRALKRIEGELGQSIFVRGNRKNNLTEFGRRFLVSARHWSNQWRHNIAELSHGRGEIKGHLKLGCDGHLGSFFLGPRLASVYQSHPKLQLDLQLGGAMAIANGVRNGQLDLGVVIGEPRLVNELTKKVIGRESVALFGVKKAVQIVYFHPEMAGVARIVRKLKGKRLIPIRDYHLIAQMALASDRAASLLPRSIARQVNGLRQIGSGLGSWSIVLLQRRDFGPSAGRDFLKKRLTSAEK